MPDMFELIESATANDDALRQALCELAAQTIAAQAFSVANSTRASITTADAVEIVEQVVGERRVKAPDLSRRVGDRASALMAQLARLRPNFFTS